MSKIKYVCFNKKDGIFDSEMVVGELLSVCEQIETDGGVICKLQIVQGELVHCKDCKYWEVDTDVGFCTRTEDWNWDSDDFCSRGERVE